MRLPTAYRKRGIRRSLLRTVRDGLAAAGREDRRTSFQRGVHGSAGNPLGTTILGRETNTDTHFLVASLLLWRRRRGFRRRFGARTQEVVMADKRKSTKRSRSAKGNDEKVLTPGGPRAKRLVHSVGAREAVVRGA